jgi:serine-type D-Ala-D-Ala carboxypeptidase (penicillin-binding protein 5/6)
MRPVISRAALPLAVLLLAGPQVLAAPAPAAAAGIRYTAAARGLAEAPGTAVGGAALATRGTVAAPGTPKLPAGITASGWVVADLDSGEVLAAKDPHGRYAPASTLKTLTAVTLIPRLPANQLVRPTWEDLNVDGSKVGLVTTLSYPVSELFTAMMVVSGNDAANALATAGGGTPATTAAMNAEAEHLHALDTHAVNASGLDAQGQVSSAYDLALVARAGMAMPDFRTYVATRMSTVAAPRRSRFQIYTHNKLLRNYPDAIGIKNGFTVKARASFVGAATRNGRTLVVTLMHADPLVWKEAAALLDWGFAARTPALVPVGQLVPAGDPEGPPPAQAAVTGAGAAAPRPALSAGGHLPWTPAALVALALTAGLVARVRRPRRRRR